MQATRTNQEWIESLSGQDSLQAESIEALRALLLRAALYTLGTHLEDLRTLDERERLALAEDCAQEALLAVLARLDDFRGESKFTTWAYKFGINLALTRARKERWKKVSLDELSDTEDSLDWLQLQQGFGTAGSETPALQEEAGALIREVIRSELTDRQRQVLKWIAFDDVPMDVVVERLKTNRNAVYKLLHDARLKVKQRLAAHGYNVEDMYDIFQAAG
jgi:RNA polymerase sigma-70 factor (ECF subfamily)